MQAIQQITLARLFNIFLVVASFVSTVKAKSVYVINDTDASEMRAYKVEDSNLVYQIDYHFVSETWGAIGLAIDESEYGQFLFATFELSDKIEVVNAKTMEYVDTVKATGASNIAGIVVDQDKDKVYVIDRGENHLYAYSWDAENKELSLDLPYPYYIELDDCEQGYGLALDEENDRLYVADNTTTVKCYDANDPNWSKLDDFTFTVTDAAIGIAIDVAKQYVYTGNGTGGGGNTYLSQYDLSADPNSAESTVNVNSPVLGIAVDQQTSLVYITTYGTGSNPDRLIIYDSNLVKQPWESGDIGHPAGVAVEGGGGINNTAGDMMLTNCLLTRNSARQGAAIWYINGNFGIQTMVNCTFSGNSAEECGGAIYLEYSSPTLTNCILWGDTPQEIDDRDHRMPVITYSDIEGGCLGEGNIDADPCFADALNGDYHLKSQAGRWDANEGRWTKDDVTSPCIDAGDMSSPVGFEPFPNGGRINMGAYGGTAEASKSYFGEPVCESRNRLAGDINGDCKVNLVDFAFMAFHWLEDNTVLPPGPP